MIKELLKGVIGQEDILNYYNATITYIDMPIRIRGCVHCYKGIYDILINKKGKILDKINICLYLCRPIYIVLRIGKA